MAKPKEKFKTYGDVFDNFTHRNLFKLVSQGHFVEDSLSPISIGKEANVFSAKTEDGNFIILKIYRLETCDFNKMYEYLRQDPLYDSIARRRRQVIFTWAQREYRNLMKAREVIRVPTPLAILHNILLLEFIGDESAALKLKDYAMEDPQAMCDEVMRMYEAYYEQGYVHGDLSEFNILVHHDSPIFIDFSQAMTYKTRNSQEMLERDIKNLCHFFRKRGAEVVDEEVLERFMKHKKVY